MKTLLMVLTGLAVAASSAPAQQRIDRTVPTAATGEVQVVNTAGNVRVRGWDRDEIRITGTLGEGAERLEVTPGRGRTLIRVVLPRNARHVRGSDLEILLPTQKDVQVRTTSADIGVAEVRGAVNAHSVSGQVEVSGSPRKVAARSTSGDVQVRGTVRESVNAESVSGSVEITAATPEVRAKSVSGSVALAGVSGRMSASTVSGDTHVRDSRIEYGSFESVSGDVRLEGQLARGAAIHAQSHSGDLILRLPNDTSAEYEVKTFSGEIVNELGPPAQRTSRYTPGRELRFATGRGEAVVVLQSFSGNVKLLER
jgi:hypothetical protein